jgi:hypothetical protein
MAVTSLWAVKGRVAPVVRYVRNPEKTTESDDVLHTVDDVVAYAANEDKTEARAFVTCLNCREESAA